MAFTFVVEDGTGLTSATSYISVADADDILTVNIHSASAWDALTDPDKERLLAWASRYLDTFARWNGRKTVETSALRWPRTGVKDRDGVVILGTAIPRQLKIATAEMARFLIAEDRSTERGQDALKKLKADVIEIEFSEGYRLPTIPKLIYSQLEGLGTLSAGKPRIKWINR